MDVNSLFLNYTNTREDELREGHPVPHVNYFQSIFNLRIYIYLDRAIMIWINYMYI